MKLSCSKDPSHKKFSAQVHEVRGWIVDENGDWERNDDQGCQMVASGPDFYSSVCMVEGCDGETEISDDDD
jgi:hypothetical protein